MSPFDTVIRGALLVDGTGAAPVQLDLAISAGRIAAIGPDLPAGAHEIDATGMVLTPGFVDVHTHYDGQVTWENRLIPSSSHGVTTAVIGNCGVGFAPCRPDAAAREGLVRLMEGVEDIPHPVLSEGLPWCWESFGDYLDFLGQRQYDMDVVAYMPHAPLRVYVMGERGANRETATPADLAEMARLLGEALEQGAAGIATSRTLFHRSSDGRPIPTYDATQGEMLALAGVLRQRGRGVFQIVEDLHLPGSGIGTLAEIAETAGRPLTFSFGTGNSGPHHYPAMLDDLAKANQRGLVMKAQVMPRAIGLVLGFDLTLNPFYTCETFRRLAHLPLAERLAQLRRADVRAAILAEAPDPDPALVLGRMVREFGSMFVLGSPPVYEQPPEASIAARAHAQGISPEELAYDILAAGTEGGRLYLAMANFAEGNLDAVGGILDHPDVVLGLGDGGAHVATICDASYSTFALTHWVRDRSHGRKQLADVVHRMSGATAGLMGLEDRGVLAVGRRADLNLIDLDALSLGPPELTRDLPGGGQRLVQRANGYRLTMIAGVAVQRDGVPTGELPGRLVRMN